MDGDVLGCLCDRRDRIYIVSPHPAAGSEKSTKKSLGALGIHGASAGHIPLYYGDDLVALVAPLRALDDSHARDIDIEVARSCQIGNSKR